MPVSEAGAASIFQTSPCMANVSARRETFPPAPGVSMSGGRKTMGPEIVIILMVLSAAAIIIWSLVLRYKRHEMRHKERMTALEKGADLPAEPPEKPPMPWSPRVYLLRGLVWLFTGAGLSAFLLGLSLTIVSH